MHYREKSLFSDIVVFPDRQPMLVRPIARLGHLEFDLNARSFGPRVAQSQQTVTISGHSSPDLDHRLLVVLSEGNPRFRRTCLFGRHLMCFCQGRKVLAHQTACVSRDHHQDQDIG